METNSGKQQKGVLTTRQNNEIDHDVQTTYRRSKSEQKTIELSKDITIRGLTITLGSKEILENTSLKLENGRHYGLIGRNGIGKTTLLRYIASGKIPQFPKLVKTLLVEQEVSGHSDLTVMQTVLSSDADIEELKERLAILESQQNPTSEEIDEISSLYEQLDSLDSETSEPRAMQILKGLGFKEESVKKKITELSGGWRMRVSLACALYCKPDLLLLDEPTNHLDLQAVIWLQEWVKKFENTVVVVSHDRAFLNAVITDVIYFNNKKLVNQTGDFDSFKKRKEDNLHKQQREHENQEKSKKQIKDSIEKYKQQVRSKEGANAALPAVKRMKKKLDRVDGPRIGGPLIAKASWRTLREDMWVWGGENLFEIVEEKEKEVSWKFPTPDFLSDGPILQLSDVSFNHLNEKTLFSGVTLDITMKSRICLLGPNGVGKTSLLNLILGNIKPKKGEIYRHKNLNIGYFTQHHIEKLDPSLTPLEYMRKLFPSEKDETLRAHLGAFSMGGKLAVQKMSTLSGGQKTRIVIAEITWSSPHILILDEPTNHLDFMSIDALIGALLNFEGGIILVSHDQHMISGLMECQNSDSEEDSEDEFNSQFYILSRGKIKRYDGSFADYVEGITPRL